MTRMPPEMSTTNTPTMTMPLPPTQQPHESLSAIQQTRSRFMINDILAGQQQQQQHQHHNQHQPGNLPTTQQQLALQHYLSQHHQQQQQQQQQQQKQYFIPIPTDSQAALRHFPQQHPHLIPANVYTPHTALMGLTPVGMQALQQQQQQQQQQQNQQHERDNGADFDERSRSPLSGSANKTINGNSSLIDDQASTIDDSDSGKEDDGSSKSDNLLGLSKKQRKARTAFSDHQLQTLEKSFERQKYLSVQDRMELANKLELSDCQVKTWYQNRRTKWKRQTAVGLELLAEAGNYAAFQRLYGGGSPYLNTWPFQAPSAPTSAIDLYYRQAAAAATLQKPLSYRLYNNMPSMSPLMPTPGVGHLAGYYHPPVNTATFPANELLPTRPQESPTNEAPESSKGSTTPDIAQEKPNKDVLEVEDDDAIEV